MEKLAPIALLLVFAAMWAAMSLLLSYMGGWASLAEHYRDNGDVRCQTYYMRSGSVGAIDYKSCLIIGVSKPGLRLSVLFPFRIGHPPLFIPWDQFHSVWERQTFLFDFLDMYVGTPVVANLDSRLLATSKIVHLALLSLGFEQSGVGQCRPNGSLNRTRPQRSVWFSARPIGRAG